MSNQSKPQESVLNWVIIGLVSLVGLGAFLWFVASHYIVFYGTPVVNALAFPWRLLPDSLSSTTVNDLNLTYQLYRTHPNRIGFMDWCAYLNVALKPWVYASLPLYVVLFQRQLRKTKILRTRKLTPETFAQKMVVAFPEIAPVVCIQKDIVANKFKEWRRQTFPDELLRAAKTPTKRPILVVDTDRQQQDGVFTRKTDAERSLKVDRLRLADYLQHTKQVKRNGQTCTFNKYLGFQITNLALDLAAPKKEGKPAQLPTDRLSDAGKAMLAILAPYAFGSNKGKKQSKEVLDALNRSAYGTEKGFANLALPIVQSTFDQWRTHEHVLNLAKIHHWEHTFLVALLAKARGNGKLTTGKFIWLRPMARVLFWALDDAGRKTPSAEGALTFSQYQFERDCIERGILPLHRDTNGHLVHTIYVDQVVRAFDQEWQHWRDGIDDTDDWLHDKELWTNLANNPVWQEAWSDIANASNLPPAGAQ